MKNIIVTGDVTADWNIARLEKGKGSGQIWTAVDRSRASLQAGGAAMLGELIKCSLKDKVKEIKVHCETLPTEIRSDDKGIHHSYAIWKPQPYSMNSKQQSWRVAEFIGIDSFCGGDSIDSCIYKPMENLPSYADIVVIDDAGLGYRAKPGVWKKVFNEKKPPEWIVVKMSSPVPDDKSDTLWQHLKAKHADRTMIITTLNDLRKNRIQVSREQSWEKLAQELYWELINNPQISSLSEIAYVVISIGPEGAFVLHRTGKSEPKLECTLYFDPIYFENSWNKDYPGSMIGYTVCQTAALVKELALDPKNPDISRGIKTGINGMRELHKAGYGSDSCKEIESLQFPYAKVVDAFNKEAGIAAAEVPNPSDTADNSSYARKGYWTILDDFLNKYDSDTKGKKNITEIARQIVIEGYETQLKEVPVGKFDIFETVDRREVEGYRGIKALIEQYAKAPFKRPLCLAVFGPPGSGKSFGVKQVANVAARGKLETITFNLSQFEEPSELIEALHQVRDICLSGKIPLVFWDEFDSADLKWLRYFLAPMQDGEFQAGQVTYHVGNAIFVFAGGTRDKMSSFDEGTAPKFKGVKGPDFISRLHGYLNIIGPNKAELPDGQEDNHFIIRRAILLRELLKRSAPGIIDHGNGNKTLCIDEGIINAFLNITKFKHGARSMEAIISGSLLAGKNYYERSCLPPKSLLDIHVNGLEFIALVQEPMLTGELLEKLAEQVHKEYSKHFSNQYSKLKYAKLPEEIKEENRRGVLDIRSKLHSIQYVMIPKKQGDSKRDIPVELIESLSIAEHDRWVCSKISQGYTYADIPEGDKSRKLHPCLVPWQKLSDEEWLKLSPEMRNAMSNQDLPDMEREKDRALVRVIPDILFGAGYIIEKIQK